MIAPQNQRPRRSVVSHLRTTFGVGLGIVGVVLATFSFSPASAANGTRRQPGSPRLTTTSKGTLRREPTFRAPGATDSISPGSLSEVVCVSAADCWAVGSQSNPSRTLIEHWNGKTWSVVTSANAPGTNQLSGVTCVSATDCWAVGYSYTAAFQGRTLVEHWDGVSWTVVTSPNVNSSHHILSAVTCASASQCWAVGEYQEAGGFYKTLIERWDGFSWTIVSSPNVAGNTYNFLAGVTCPNATTCFAVGQYSSISTPTYTLTLRWDGVQWAIIASPNATQIDYNILDGVDCLSAEDCYAVGYYLNASPEWEQTLIMHWNGFSWTIVPSANVSTTKDNELDAISCTSSTDCWAVGIFVGAADGGTMIEHWNGTAWAIATPPAPISPYDYLYGVNCLTSSNCWAVGTTGEGPQTLAEQWNGTAWSIVPTEADPASSLEITGITRDSSSIFIDGFGPGSSNIDIRVTSDLKQPFVFFGSTPSNAIGSFHFQDSVPAGTPQRFYRATYH